jgi:ATP-dependent helicase HrpB
MASATSADLQPSGPPAGKRPRPQAPLPIDEHLATISAALSPGATVLLQAPPGAGKTTRVPVALLESLGGQDQILMLEPRRLAARGAAQRIADQLGENLGGRVGYRVRLESRVSAATRLEVVTTGIFLRRLQADPALDGVSCVIFDEFHERQAEADLALALVRQSRELLRPDLRLLVMSATLDLEPLAHQLDDARVISSRGRSHPVDTHHQPPREREPLEQQVIRALEQHWLPERQAAETVLVFLPGQKELLRCQQGIGTTAWGADLECVLLHGQLSLAGQAAAIRPAQARAGKLVLATAIAESSLTIEGVRLVIDSGLSRRNRFDPSTALDGLVTVPCSQASAEQRRGRAGRLGPGVCVRLWSAAEQQRRPAFDPPELLEVDPLPIALQLAAWGATPEEPLPWLQPPPAASLATASRQLQQLGAIDENGRISSHGRALAELGLPPRLGHMLLRARSEGCLELAASLAVLLSEKDPLDRREVGCDLMPRIDLLHRQGWARDPGERRPAGPAAPRQLLRLRQQLLAQVAGSGPPSGAPPEAIEASTATAPAGEPLLVARLLSWAYPERIALGRGRGDGRYLMAGGRGAVLPDGDPLGACDSLAIAAVDGQGQEARIRLAVPLPPALLEELAAEQAQNDDQVRWEPAGERVRSERRLRLGALVLEREPWANPDPARLRQAMLEGLRLMGLEALPWCSRSRQLQQRLSLAHRHLGDPWPDRSPEALQAHLDGWLGEHLDGIRSRQELQRLDLIEALWGVLDWGHRQQLDQWLPDTLSIPSGRKVPLDYSSGEPVLAAKLQEMFGWQDTPVLLQGKLPVTVQLLSPAGRPAAITRDLAGFWSGGYAEVRKELRGRYPKHPWPDDPCSAQPTALTKARLHQRSGAGPAADGRNRNDGDPR